jgi:perosamine synthetase
MRYPLAVPHLAGREIEYVTECLRSGWVSSRGPFVGRFERAFASSIGRRHAIATCNGTAALHLPLLALGLGPGDEVIVPSLTYVATANAVTYCGAQPVFADSDSQTGCLSVASVSRLLSPRTRGIIPVHLYGHPCAMEPLLELARSHGLWVLEDCAEAQGATCRSSPVGSFGTAAAFSFFGNKIMTTGEGGMVVTDDTALADRMRLLGSQGMDPQRRYWHPVVGYNFRMTNLAAALGLAQLERLEQLVDDRRRVAAWYRQQLRLAPGLTLPGEADWASNAYWLYSVLVDSADRRDALAVALAGEGIETRPFFHPVHELPMYRHSRTDRGCRVARNLSARGLSLPTSSYLLAGDVAVISEALTRALARLQNCAAPWQHAA